ncbi:fibronectin type III domain-containing protein [Runella sp.]|uniref:fibronectin type III domain-containing protein n=1 Tax=Runella sp. TaxID=1960881 RepID=UPI003D0F7B3C
MKKLFLFLVFTIPLVKAFAQSEAPSNLTAVAVSSKQVNLTWKDNSSRESLFEIERSTTSETSGFSKLGEVSANITSYTDGNAPANTYSYYRVRAKTTATAFTGYSNVVYAFPPVTPTISKIEVKGTNWIAITFKVQGGKENGNVVIQRRQGQGGAWSTIGTFDSNLTFYDDQAVPQDNTEYCYRVYWSGAPNEFSNISCATTLSLPPNPPTNLSAVAVSSSQINLSWTDASNNESGFEIFRSTDNANFSKIADVGANVTTYQNTGLNASTRYYYYVGSQRGGTPSRAKSNTADATTFASVPSPPSNLSAVAIGSNQINLNWSDNSNNETGFELERSTDGVNFGKIQDIAANATSFSNTGLNPSIKYWYRVRAKNGAGNSGYSNVADATTQAPPVTIPRLPTALTAAASSSSQINLSWTDNSGDEAGFELERSTDGVNFGKIQDIAANATSFSNTGLNASTKYYYRIRAVNSAGPSPYSNIADATTQAPPIVIPQAPGSLSASAASSNQINLVWSDNSNNETGFELERSTDGINFGKIQDVAANTTTFSNIGLNASTKYYYRIRSKNTAGNSAYSNTADATTQAPPVTIPQPPTLLAATAISAGQINLSWSDNANDETGFELERSVDGINFTKIIDLGANTTSYSNTGLSSSTKYYYHVRAKNSAGNSAYSNIADATTLLGIPGAPTNLTAVLADYDQARLTWPALPATVATIVIERSTSPTGGFSQIAQQTANTTTYLDLGLSELTTYYYRIQSKNAAGASGYSNVVNVTTPEVIIAVRPQPSAVGLTVFSANKVLHLQNNWHQTTHFEWTLVSMNGRNLHSETTVINSRQTLTYDFPGLQSGLYVVLVRTENQVFSQKIMLY